MTYTRGRTPAPVTVEYRVMSRETRVECGSTRPSARASRLRSVRLRVSGGVQPMSVLSVAPRRHRVVIIGSGFGGLFAAKHLKRADVDVTVIAKTTHHLFQPLLYQVATGILSVGEIAPATRMILRKQKNAKVLLGDVVGIDLKDKIVTSKLMDWQRVTPFDSLIVAAGAQQSYFGNDHFEAFAPGMKTVDDALELRGRILGAFEAAEVTESQAE